MGRASREEGTRPEPQRGARRAEMSYCFSPRFLMIVGTSFYCGAQQTRTFPTRTAFLRKCSRWWGRRPWRRQRRGPADPRGPPQPQAADHSGAGEVPSRTPAMRPVGMSWGQTHLESQRSHKPGFLRPRPRTNLNRPGRAQLTHTPGERGNSDQGLGLRLFRGWGCQQGGLENKGTIQGHMVQLIGGSGSV